MAHWLLQNNPRRWRLAEFLEEHTLDELGAWSITRYLDQVNAGDDLAMWQTDSNAGVIALGHATGPPYEAAGAADAYWEDREQADRTRWWLPLQLTEVFLDAPVTREELRHDPRFAQAAILRQPWAGNPFLLRMRNGKRSSIGTRALGRPATLVQPPNGRCSPGRRFAAASCMTATAAADKTASAPRARPPTSSSSPTHALGSSTATTTSGQQTAVFATPAAANAATRR
jgi:predicted RNA-binding protein with PUA-like domain